MTFEDFAQLCGVSIPSGTSNGLSKLNIEYLFRRIPLKLFLDEKHNENDQSLKTILDNRVNCLREDFKDDLNRTKLSMQMNFIVQLERLRVNLSSR